MGKGYTYKNKSGGPPSDAMKILLKKLKEDPSQLDSSGMGDWFKLSQKDKLKFASLKKKKKKGKG